MRRLSEARGARYVTSFLWKWPTRKLLTAHPLGGCAIGESDADGVVNHRGEVWNYPGLYVTDGAAVPSALSVTPSLTIAALAEISSDRLEMLGFSPAGGHLLYAATAHSQ